MGAVENWLRGERHVSTVLKLQGAAKDSYESCVRNRGYVLTAGRPRNLGTCAVFNATAGTENFLSHLVIPRTV